MKAATSGPPRQLPIQGELSGYMIKHGAGLLESLSIKHGQIHTMLHVSMALEDPVKITTLRVTNKGSTKRQLTITSYVEWVLGVSRDLTQQYVHTSFDQESMIACSARISSISNMRIRSVSSR